MNKLTRWFDDLRQPDPLKVALKENRALTETLCETMEKFERTVTRYNARPRTVYGRRSEDDTIPQVVRL